MSQALPAFRADRPLDHEGTQLFVLIIISAIALATIIVTKTFELLDLQMTMQFYLSVLVATGCVAFPVAGLATQYDLNARTLQDVVPTDPVSGLYSAKFLELTIEGERGTNPRPGQMDSIMAFEIDYLPRIRKQYGDDYGDNIVRWVTELAVANLRIPQDKLAYAGDGAFIALLRNASVSQTESVCTRIQNEVKEAEVEASTDGHKLTLSFGLSPLPSGLDYSLARREAETALADARRFGRDQIRSRYLTSANQDEPKRPGKRPVPPHRRRA